MVNHVTANILALTGILTSVLRHISAVNPELATAISEGFDEAAVNAERQQ
jgi:hypothetical protein